jgi:hypothetical protein
MKKIYSFVAMLLVTSLTFAQMFEVGSASSKVFNHDMSSAKVASDTTGLSVNFLPVFAVGLQVITYTDMSGGYVYGVNGNAFPAIAQGYTHITSGNIGILGVVMWFSGKKSISNNPASKLTFTIYNKPDSLPTTQVGTTSADLLFSACDTNFLHYNSVLFPSVITVSSDFSVVCSFANIKTDTIGFFSDQDGEGAGYTALKYGSTWYTYNNAYGGLNTNISLFAIIDNFVNVDGDVYFEGSKMTINQNPTRDNLSISYAVEKDSKVDFELISLDGKVVYKSDEGFRTCGNIYSINANISNLAAGDYLCSLNCNGKRLIKKVVVE